ncbi:MAG TPA: disulfide bond formation protein B [Caulobacteraceae bacterium]|jgi:disulfide bond formation protein DsbB|nr:disulfide bond formation protein B [Caulobacteraceae bacterium]
MSRLSFVLRWWPIFALIASAAMLAIAHAFESFGGLAPCHLCLKQREAYWAACAVAAVGVALAFTPWEARGRRIVSALLALVFLYGAGYAIYHAGAEWKFWPGPQSCSGAATAVSAADLAAVLKGARSSAPPACDQAAWVFLGLSMAGWNALVSLGLAAVSSVAALRRAAA